MTNIIYNFKSIKWFLILGIGLISQKINSQNINNIQIGPTHQSVQFVNNNVGYSIAYSMIDGSIPNGLIRKTVDGGNNWTNLIVTFSPIFSNFPLANTILLRDKLQFLNENVGFCGGYLYSSQDEVTYDVFVILKTTNGGNSWFPIHKFDNVIVNDFYFIDENRGYVTMNDLILKTNNGGQNYVQIYQNPFIGQTCNRIYFYNDNIGFVGSTNRIHKTNNGGISWSTINIPLGVSVNYFLFINENIGFFSTISNGRIFKTTDGGLNWTLIQQEMNTSLANFQIIDNQILVCGYSSIISSACPIFLKKSTDNGNSWVKECMNVPEYSATSIIEFYSSSFLAINKAFFGVSGRLLKYTSTLNSNIFNKPNIKIYPNPANDFIFIDVSESIFDKISYSIYNNLGVLVNSGEIDSMNSKINIEELNYGFYIVKFDNYQFEYKLIVN